MAYKPKNHPEHKCLRCGYVWIRRQEGEPKRCASVECRSPYWNTPPKRKLARRKS